MQRYPSLSTGFVLAYPTLKWRCDMSEKESITTLLTLLESRQARLTAACKEIADWVDHQGGHPAAVRIRDRLNDIEKDAPSIQSALSSLKPVDRPLPKFR
jgi:hypothetical protein